MNDIEVGDLVKLTSKSRPERTITDYVIGRVPSPLYTVTTPLGLSLESQKGTPNYYAFKDWDVEVLEKPFKPMTGLYWSARERGFLAVLPDGRGSFTDPRGCWIRVGPEHLRSTLENPDYDWVFSHPLQ